MRECRQSWTRYVPPLPAADVMLLRITPLVVNENVTPIPTGVAPAVRQTQWINGEPSAPLVDTPDMECTIVVAVAASGIVTSAITQLVTCDEVGAVVPALTTLGF